MAVEALEAEARTLQNEVSKLESLRSRQADRAVVEAAPSNLSLAAVGVFTDADEGALANFYEEAGIAMTWYDALATVVVSATPALTATGWGKGRVRGGT